MDGEQQAVRSRYCAPDVKARGISIGRDMAAIRLARHSASFTGSSRTPFSSAFSLLRPCITRPIALLAISTKTKQASKRIGTMSFKIRLVLIKLMSKSEKTCFVLMRYTPTEC